MYNYGPVRKYDILIIARYDVIYVFKYVRVMRKRLRSGAIAVSGPLHNNQMYNDYTIDGLPCLKKHIYV
jgi:hypothetical protein